MLSVADIKTAVEPILEDTKVRKLILFGSYAEGTASENSDIDLYMVSDGEITGLAFYDLKSRIEDAFVMDIDLLPDLDVIPESPLARRINESGVVIFER